MDGIPAGLHPFRAKTKQVEAAVSFAARKILNM
jgi:hypothetical protein